MLTSGLLARITRHLSRPTVFWQSSGLGRRLFSLPDDASRSHAAAGTKLEQRDPAAALRAFYGEDISIPAPTQTRENEDRRMRPVATGATTLSVPSIAAAIADECDAKVAVYANADGLDRGTPANLVLQLESNRERITLAESLVKKFRPLLGGREVSCEGMNTKDADWIVIDLVVAMVHIFDPQARLEYDLDSKLAEARKGEETAEEVLEGLSNSLPRKIAGDPSRPEPTRDNASANVFLT